MEKIYSNTDWDRDKPIEPNRIFLRFFYWKNKHQGIIIYWDLLKVWRKIQVFSDHLFTSYGLAGIWILNLSDFYPVFYSSMSIKSKTQPECSWYCILWEHIGQHLVWYLTTFVNNTQTTFAQIFVRIPYASFSQISWEENWT